MLRIKPGHATSTQIEEIYKKSERAYMKEIEKASESTDSNAYIKDDKGLIHKFKLNMKTCVDHAKTKNTNENETTESQENLSFKLQDQDEKEESEGVANSPIEGAGKAEKILTERNVEHSGSVSGGARMHIENKASRADGVLRIKTIGSGIKLTKRASVDKE